MTGINYIIINVVGKMHTYFSEFVHEKFISEKAGIDGDCIL